MTELHDRPVDFADLDLDPDDYSSNPSAAPSFQDVVSARLSRRAVERVMATTMQRTGDRFATNLYHHLGIEPP